MALTAAQIDDFFRDGFIVPHWRMPTPDLQRLRRAYRRLIKDNPATTTLNTVHRKDGGMMDLTIIDDWVSLGSHPDIMDMLEQLMGPDICLWDMLLFDKPAQHSQVIGWHQDGLYWPIRPIQTLAVWISLDGSTSKKGCVKVVRGSHRERSFYVHEDATGQVEDAFECAIPSSVFDDSDVVEVILEPGQISIHDLMIIHGSDANRSDERRVGVVSRYMPTTSWFDHSAGEVVDAQYLPYFAHAPGKRYWPDAPLYRLRGGEGCGLNDFAIGHHDEG